MIRKQARNRLQYHIIRSPQGRPKRESTAIDAPDPNDDPSSTTLANTTEKTKNSSWHVPRWDWRSNVKLALAISVIAFITNLVLLVVGATSQGYADGIGTLHSGTVKKVARLSTTYHVLINVLSTGLLTSSNYCMQLICAPTRADIDAAHAQGGYFDIGILSLRNVRRIPRGRAILWTMLAASSIPLHLLYNSAVFSVTVGRDYELAFFNASDSSLVKDFDDTHHRMINAEWMKTYDTKFVPDYGKLLLAVDAVSFEIQVNQQNLSWQFEIPRSGTDYTWEELPSPDVNDTSFQVNFPLRLGSPNGIAGEVEEIVSSTERRRFQIEDYSPSRLPSISFPDTRIVNISTHGSWKDVLSLNQDAWMDPPWHIAYAFAEPMAAKSAVQVSIPFIGVVLACNAVKVVAIYCTLRGSYSSQIITQGDAVAAFLERPDWSTISFCTADKKTLVDAVQKGMKPESQSWEYRQTQYSDRARGRWVSYCALGVVVAISAIGILAVGLKGLSPWGTASPNRLPIRTSGLSAKGILFISWLANSPQLFLSLCYLAANRICTSLCFAREWNDHALYRKGLRLTQPRSASQRSAFFLQLPYRWAVPLTVMSGVLHWLLSQTLFLVRLEMHGLHGEFKTDSTTCTCGYSMSSLLVFLICFFLMALGVLLLMLRPITYHLPPADHCSLVISAACHPPPGEDDAHLGLVQWGVVPSVFGGSVEHCSFSSKDVAPPREGAIYA